MAIFRRDLNGFIQNYQTTETDALGPVLVTRPYNSGAGRIDGAEAAITAFADLASLPTWATGLRRTGERHLPRRQDRLPGGARRHGDNGTAAHRRRVEMDLQRRPDLRIRRPVDAAVVQPAQRLPVEQRLQRRLPQLQRNDGTDRPARLLRQLRPVQEPDPDRRRDQHSRPPAAADRDTVFTGGPTVVLPRSIRYEESVYSLGVRFRF